MRWTDDKAARFQALRRAEAQGALPDADRAELDALLSDLDADEADALRPAMARLEARAVAVTEEKISLDTRARELLRIAEEEAQLLADAANAARARHQ